MNLSSSHQRRLVMLAWQAIRDGAMDGLRPSLFEVELSPRLRQIRASFVTLSRDGQLRGCCGTLWPRLPLAEDVQDNAWKTAFEDPRFSPLQPQELPRLHLEISVLSELAPVPATDPAQLMAEVLPGQHGLVIARGHRRATFLPKVWESLPDPALFLEQLMHKGGFRDDDWVAMEAWTYTTEQFGGQWSESALQGADAASR